MLARTLGCTVRELELRLTADEFGEWWALYRMEPWGETRSDIAAGMIASTLANIHRKENARPFGPLDFAPYLKPREAPVEVDPAAFIEGIRSGH